MAKFLFPFLLFSYYMLFRFTTIYKRYLDKNKATVWSRVYIQKLVQVPLHHEMAPVWGSVNVKRLVQEDRDFIRCLFVFRLCLYLTTSVCPGRLALVLLIVPMYASPWHPPSPLIHDWIHKPSSIICRQSHLPFHQTLLLLCSLCHTRHDMVVLSSFGAALAYNVAQRQHYSESVECRHMWLLLTIGWLHHTACTIPEIVATPSPWDH